MCRTVFDHTAIITEIEKSRLRAFSIAKMALNSCSWCGQILEYCECSEIRTSEDSSAVPSAGGLDV